MATLKELSEYTGFSITTISRVLNNDPTMNVSDATRSKILQAAGELQYKKPNIKQRVIKENNMCFAVQQQDFKQINAMTHHKSAGTKSTWFRRILLHKNEKGEALL